MVSSDCMLGRIQRVQSIESERCNSQSLLLTLFPRNSLAQGYSPCSDGDLPQPVPLHEGPTRPEQVLPWSECGSPMAKRPIPNQATGPDAILTLPPGQSICDIHI